MGTITVPRAAVCITRNYDYDFTVTAAASTGGEPYEISRPVDCDVGLQKALIDHLESGRDEKTKDVLVQGNVVNASCDRWV